MYRQDRFYRVYCTLVAALLCSWADLLAADLRFQRLTIKDGLPHDSVYSIIQDRHGFIWMGTDRGICRFDGYQFLTYNHDPFSSGSLSSNSIINLLENQDGNIWVGTWGGGLNLFDPITEQFTRFRANPEAPRYSLASDRVQSIGFDIDAQLWIGTYSNGLSRWLPNLNRFVNFRHRPGDPQSLPSNRIWSIDPLDANRIFLGTDAGLSIYNSLTGVFSNFQHDSENPSCNRVRDVLLLEKGRILVGTDCGLQIFNPETEQFQPLSLGSESAIAIRALHQDHRGRIWVGTLGDGLFEVDLRTSKIKQYLNTPGDSETLAHNSVQAILEDRSRVLWIATLGGISRTDLKPQKFKQHRPDPTDPTTISGDSIAAMFQDEKGDLWVGTYGAGLNRVPANSGPVKSYGPQSDPALPTRVVNHILETRPGEFWLSTLDSGLIFFVPERNEVRVLKNDPEDPHSVSSSRVREAITNQKGQLWLATDKGVNIWTPDTQKFLNAGNHTGLKENLGDPLIYTLAFDGTGNLWAGTERGPKVIQSETLAPWSPANPNQICENLSQIPIFSIHCDRNGAVWLGTNAGLYGIHPTAGFVGGFSQKEGLISNTIIDILEDHQGLLWLATDQGISRLDVATNTIRNFDFRDGLITNAFNRNASFVSKDGTIYLGGRGGYNSFRPEQVKPNPYIPPVVLTRISFLNQSVATGGRALNMRQLSLGFDTKMVTFDFAALDFTLPDKNQFQFKLEGFNNEWINAGAVPSVSYTNLAPGNYTFKVRGSNNDGIWNENGIDLQLKVIPPWWKTSLAYFGFFLLGTLLILGIPILRIRFLNRQSLKLQARIDQQTQTARERNAQLEEKNNELLTLDQIVETINQEWRIDRLVDAILEQAIKFFPNAQYGAFLKFDHQDQVFKFVSATDERHPGLLDIRLPMDLALKRYTAGREKLNEGVYLLRQYADWPRSHSLSNFRKPVTLLVMTLNHKNRIDGILLLENYDDLHAFRDSDVEKLKRFRDHATSAIARSNLMNELSLKAKHLYDTQQLLMENAHQAGMAEVASNVLHSVGNALNSINTSADIISEIGRESPAPLFEKIVNLMASKQENLHTFLLEDPQGKKLPDALVKISNSLSRSQQNILGELEILNKHITGLRQVVRAQQDFANMDGAVFETHISACIEEALQIEKSILDSKEIRIVRELADLPHVKIQKSKLLRILVHLIGYAAEAMSQQPSRILFLRTSMSQNRISIEIRNTGRGLTEEKMATLFHQNLAGPSDQKGLGLHYCATAADEMGGQLTVASLGIGQGSQFTLVLPMRNKRSAQNKARS